MEEEIRALKKDNSKAHINQAYVALTLSIFLYLPIFRNTNLCLSIIMNKYIKGKSLDLPQPCDVNYKTRITMDENKFKSLQTKLNGVSLVELILQLS